MTCLEVQDLMAGLVAEALPEERRAGLAAHVAACPACREAERRIRAAWDSLGALEVPPPPLDLKARLEAALDHLPAAAVPPPLPSPPRRLPVLPLAAGLLLLGGGWAVWRLLPGESAALPDPAAAPEPAPLPAEPEPLLPWTHAGEGPLRLVGVPGALLWAGSGSGGGFDDRHPKLRLDEGEIWGRPLEGEMVRLELGAWRLTVIRGTFTASATAESAAVTCHEGFLRVDAGPGLSEPLAVPERTTVLLVPGRGPVGPRPARTLYPGEPGLP